MKKKKQTKYWYLESTSEGVPWTQIPFWNQKAVQKIVVRTDCLLDKGGTWIAGKWVFSLFI